MKILITGAEGQLGRDLVAALGGNHDLYPFDLDLDITDGAAVWHKTQDIKPEIIINCAAYTDVDGCETNVDAAYLANAVGPQNLALAAKDLSVPLVTISTDYVFDGTKATPYDEFDTMNPAGVYGRSKMAGEILTRNICPEHYIIRTAWLYGRTGKNFVKTILKLAEERDELTVVDDQIGSPTYSVDLAGRIIELMTTGWYGTYHVTNSGNASWYEFAKEILKAVGKEGVNVRPMKTKDLDRPAPRPANSVLDNRMTRLRGLADLRDYHQALAAYFGSDRP
ncbi:MAG: dTDP-4-dehydrorhamnose reductase [Actinomycetota bacterium]